MTGRITVSTRVRGNKADSSNADDNKKIKQLVIATMSEAKLEANGKRIF